MAYAGAVRDRDHIARVKTCRSKRIPNARDAFTLQAAMYGAQARYDELCEVGAQFRTTRELIDAGTAAWLAEERYDIAQEKFQDAKRLHRADKAAGIVRTNY